MLAAIPYTTFPEIDLGPVSIRTFGLMVAIGVMVGTLIASRLGERWGVPTDDTIGLATRLVIAGVIGSRITWVLTHLDQIEDPIDVVAVWEGGLQFSGGFLAAIVVGLPTFRKWSRATRWRMLDGLALGLTVGLAIGRIGCYAVGEHLGGPTGFFLGTRYDGGDTREGPLAVGTTIHNTSLYELLFLLVIAAVLWWTLRRRPVAGSLMGGFCVLYGIGRFSTDFLRTYDDTVLGLTGAQWMCLALVPAGLVILTRVRGSMASAGVYDEETDATSSSYTDESPASTTG